MPMIKIILNGENCWPDLKGKLVHHITNDFQMAGLPSGMESGKPSITIRIDINEKEVVIVETSWALLLSTMDAFLARYGDPR